MGLKQFVKNLWIFVVYLCTQPFIEIWKFFKPSPEGSPVAYVSSWRFPFLVATLLFYLVGNKIMVNLFGLLLILTILKTEWDDRRWLDKYRKAQRRKAEKKLKEQETGG